MGSAWPIPRSISHAKKFLQEITEHPRGLVRECDPSPCFPGIPASQRSVCRGGGELAYWLELKQVFDSSEVPFPVLVLRNSFMLVNASASSLLSKTGIIVSALFKRTLDLQNELVRRHATLRLDLDEEKTALNKIYAIPFQVYQASLTQHWRSIRKLFLRTQASEN